MATTKEMIDALRERAFADSPRIDILLAAAADRLERTSDRWIPCAERLPDETDKYWVT